MNPETNKFELLRPDTDQNEDPGPEDIGRLQRMVQRLKESDKIGPRQTTTALLRPNGRKLLCGIIETGIGIGILWLFVLLVIKACG